MKILCIDLETSGLDESQSGIVQIGAQWLHSGAQFFRECRPCTLRSPVIEGKALEVNGVTREQLADSKRLPETIAIVEFLGWVRGNLPCDEKVQIAAWNAHFDYRHFMAALVRASAERHTPFVHRLLDLHSLVAGDMLKQLCIAPSTSSFTGRIANGVVAYNGVASSDMGSMLLGLNHESKPHNALNGAMQVRAQLRRFLGDVGALANSTMPLE